MSYGGSLKQGLSSDSLRDLFSQGKQTRSSKRGGRAKSPSDSVVMVDDVDSIMRSILLEETGSFVRRPQGRSKRTRSDLGATSSSGGAARVAASRSALNSALSFATTLGMPEEDVSYIEKQFRKLHVMLKASEKKLLSGYEDLQIDTSDEENRRKPVESFVFDQAVQLARYAGIEIDEEDLFDICRSCLMPFDQQRTVPVGASGIKVEEMSYENASELDSLELDFRKWKPLILSFHRKRLIMGVLAERRGRGFDQHSSFLDSQTRPEYNNAPLTVGQHNESFNSLSQVSSAASMLESPSVATYHTSDLFDDFDVFGGSKSQLMPQMSTHTLFSKTSQPHGPASAGGSSHTLPRINSVPNLKFRSKSKKLSGSSKGREGAVGSLKRTASQPIVERPEDDMDPMARVAALRRELESAQQGLAVLDTKVEANIAWVHSNCDISVLGPISREGRGRLQKVAIDRLFGVVQSRLLESMFRAMRHWEQVVFTEKIGEIARDYEKVKGIEILTRTLDACICRRLQAGWTPWRGKQLVAERWEQTFAAVEIQRVARGMRVRLFLKDQLIRRSIIKIQSLLRRRLATKRVKKVRHLRYLSDKKNEKLKRQRELEKSKKGKGSSRLMTVQHPSLPMTEHSKHLTHARNSSAAIKIQKLHRGRMGRERFQKFREDHAAVQVQKVVRGKLGRERHKRIKEESSKGGSWLGGMLSGKPKEKKKKKKEKKEKKALFSSGGDKGGQGKSEDDNTEALPKSEKSSSPSGKNIIEDKASPSVKASAPVPDTGSSSSSGKVHGVSRAKEKDAEAGARLIKKTDTEGKTTEVSEDKTAGTTKNGVVKPSTPGDAAAAAAARKPTSPSAKTTSSSSKSAKPTTPKTATAAVGGGKTSGTKSSKPSTPNSTQKVETPKASQQRAPPVTADSDDDSPRAPSAAAPKASLGKLQQQKMAEEKKRLEREMAEQAAKMAAEAEERRLQLEAEAAEVRKKMEIELKEAKVQAEDAIVEAREELEAEMEEEKATWMAELEALKKANEELQEAKAAAEREAAEKQAKAEADLKQALEESAQKAQEAAAAAARAAEAEALAAAAPAISVDTKAEELEAAKEADGQRSRPTSATVKPSSPTSPKARPQSPKPGTQEQPEERPVSQPRMSIVGSLGMGSKAKDPPSESEGGERKVSMFGRLSMFGGGMDKSDGKIGDKKKKKKKFKKGEVNPDFVRPDISKVEAQKRINRQCVVKASYNELKRRRAKEMAAQELAGRRILWATVLIQARIARGPIGRRKFVQRQDDLIAAREVRRNKAATKIQAFVRAVPDRVRVKGIREEKAREEKMASMLKFKKDQEDANAFKVQGSGLTPEQERALQEKLDKLAAMEKSIIEKELKMAQASRLAEERAQAMEKALKEFEERARREEAERALQKQMLDMAAGPIATGRSEVTIEKPSTVRTPRTKRDNQDPPPTARSAREEGIPKDAPKVSFEGRKWYQLWDEQESAYYWYCSATKAAQWEKPGDPPGTGYTSDGGLTDYSTDWYESGGEYTDGEGGESWQEYYDEAAQAKYWYNPATGEASWVQPNMGAAGGGSDSSGGRRKTKALVSAQQVPAGAYTAPDEWVSYLDSDTQQEYWYNTRTGETSWER